MVTPYFASLAEKALLAAKSNLSNVQGEVATLLAAWGQKLPQLGLPRRAGDVRDDLQEALNQALSPPLEKGKAETPLQPPARTLEVQIRVLDSRLDRIEQVVGKIEGTLGDWGWGEQANYLCAKHEPQKRFTGARNWSEFLPKVTSPRPAPTEAGHSVRQQTLNRLNDLNTLVDSYTPLMARRLAADLTAHDRIDEIFQKYGFERTGSDDETTLTNILAGDAFPEKMDPKEFKGWPCAAVGGSFAQELATALDYMPSTWALARELASQGLGGRDSGGQGSGGPGGGAPADPVTTNISPKDTAWKAGLMGLAFSGGGIRSATFSLGVLQGLAKLGLLRKFHYLSTVSGGGYIGSWLINWIKQDGVGEVERRLCPDFTPDPRDLRLEPIRFLRDFSNYLSPQMGLLSADLWVMAVVWVRNTLLNLLILLPAMFAVLLVPRVPEMWAHAVAPVQLARNNTLPDSSLPVCHLPAGYLWAFLLTIVWIVILVGLNLRQFPADVGGAGAVSANTRQRFYSRPWGVLTLYCAAYPGGSLAGLARTVVPCWRLWRLGMEVRRGVRRPHGNHSPGERQLPAMFQVNSRNRVKS